MIREELAILKSWNITLEEFGRGQDPPARDQQVGQDLLVTEVHHKWVTVDWSFSEKNENVTKWRNSLVNMPGGYTMDILKSCHKSHQLLHLSKNGKMNCRHHMGYVYALMQ